MNATEERLWQQAVNERNAAEHKVALLLGVLPSIGAWNATVRDALTGTGTEANDDIRTGRVETFGSMDAMIRGLRQP